MKELKVPAAGLISWPVVVAVAINLVPIAGVLFWGWSAFALIFLYWLENLVIGVRTLAAMIANGLVARETPLPAVLFFAAFFTIHYGLFCFGHGAFILLLFGGGVPLGENILDVAGAAREMFAREPGLATGLASIVLWQAVQFALFLTRGEARTANTLSLMGEPYPRIIVLHVTILAGGFLLMLLNQPLWGLVLLAVVKLAFDVAAARRPPKPAVQA